MSQDPPTKPTQSWGDCCTPTKTNTEGATPKGPMSLDLLVEGKMGHATLIGLVVRCQAPSYFKMKDGRQSSKFSFILTDKTYKIDILFTCWSDRGNRSVEVVHQSLEIGKWVSVTSDNFKIKPYNGMVFDTASYMCAPRTMSLDVSVSSATTYIQTLAVPSPVTLGDVLGISSIANIQVNATRATACVIKLESCSTVVDVTGVSVDATSPTGKVMECRVADQTCSVQLQVTKSSTPFDVKMFEFEVRQPTYYLLLGVASLYTDRGQLVIRVKPSNVQRVGESFAAQLGVTELVQDKPFLSDIPTPIQSNFEHIAALSEPQGGRPMTFIVNAMPLSLWSSPKPLNATSTDAERGFPHQQLIYSSCSVCGRKFESETCKCKSASAEPKYHFKLVFTDSDHKCAALDVWGEYGMLFFGESAAMLIASLSVAQQQHGQAADADTRALVDVVGPLLFVPGLLTLSVQNQKRIQVVNWQPVAVEARKE